MCGTCNLSIIKICAYFQWLTVICLRNCFVSIRTTTYHTNGKCRECNNVSFFHCSYIFYVIIEFLFIYICCIVIFCFGGQNIVLPVSFLSYRSDNPKVFDSDLLVKASFRQCGNCLFGKSAPCFKSKGHSLNQLVFKHIKYRVVCNFHLS